MMGNYRPITDMWIMARAKLKGGHKYYGAYPGGFLERARALLGVHINETVLHVCGGRVKDYPYKHAVGYYDDTMDLDPDLNPDYLHDASKPFPKPRLIIGDQWAAILIDPPYTEDDAEKYKPGASKFPKANLLLKNALNAVRPGGRVGILHYIWPSPPKDLARCVATVGVLTGYNNRIRLFSVYERILLETV